MQPVMKGVWVLREIRLPPPTPDVLRKDFCLEPGLGWKFLLTGWPRNLTGTGNQNRRNRFSRNPKNLLRLLLGDNLQRLNNPKIEK